MSEQSFCMNLLAEFAIEETPSHEPTVRHVPSDIYLHSTRDPVHEANRIARSWIKNVTKDIVLWGLGLGYIARALLKHLPAESRLWIIETHPELRALAENAHPFWRLWHDSRADFIVSQSVRRLQDFLARIPKEAQVWVHAPTMTLLRWEGGPLCEILESVTLPLKNSQAYSQIVLSQVEANASYLSRCKDVRELFSTWKDEPVLILGAGPSLTRVLDEIVHMSQKPRMIASNGALPALSQRGITPDLAMCIESRSSAHRDIERADYTGPLVIFPAVNHELLRDYSGALYLAFPSAEADTEKNELVSGVGTVMVPALDLAAKMGGNPILLAGLDLGWGKNLYAEGVMREQSSPLASVRTTSVSGNTFWTSPAFAAFGAGLGRMIENIRTANPQILIYDLKTSGMKIPGAITWPPEKISELLPFNELIRY